MKNPSLRLGFALLASGGPVAFPLAQMGYAPLERLAVILILPSAGLLLAITGYPEWRGHSVGRAIRSGLVAGAVATVALEAVRYTGFRLGFMPGNLPELMGVLLLNRFALGPSAASTAAGFAYHYWNGAAFGAIFATLFLGRPRWWSILYGVAIGFGFLVSPVVQSLGVGLLGKDFGWHFAATVLTAHAAYGATLGALSGVRRERSRKLRAEPLEIFRPVNVEPCGAQFHGEPAILERPYGIAESGACGPSNAFEHGRGCPAA